MTVQDSSLSPDSDITHRVDASVLLDYFQQLDASQPLSRLFFAAAVVGLSILILITVRIIVYRRCKRLQELPPNRIRPLRLQAQELVTSEEMQHFWINVWRGVGWLFTLIFVTTAIAGGLMATNFTLHLGSRLLALVLSILDYLWSGFVDYLPNLFTIIVILVIMRYLIRMIGLIFEGISSRRINLRHFYPEWANTSFGIVKLLIYVLTAVLIFPYLPGSSSPAFQGISIFVGVLVSLGSTSAVANVVAGVVLTYTRAFHIGDQVEIADVRGRIVERSTFVTRIQTLKNVVVSIPNSMVLNNNIINYSKNLGQTGLLVHTSITIGYDVPWKKVNELLIAAAKNTDGITSYPDPFVLQTALQDNYVSYEINGWTRKPEELPKIYSSLHANILDQFHGHDVEITSPSFHAVRDGNASTVAPVTPAEPAPTENNDDGEPSPSSTA